MWPLIFLLGGFLVVTFAMAFLVLYLKDFENRVAQFCELIRNRYRPTFHKELEELAARKVEEFTSSSKT
ncbi:MAG TPA: hypothetical protein VLM37_10810 [Fibrobacteraceae bacterium]|nr:hypothetical protein [Fibrobacteraceae bacterium]